MLKKEITYEDLDGNTTVDVFYFNLTRTELMQFEVDYEGGMSGAIRRMIESKDNKEIYGLFNRIVLTSYGVRSDDGKRFVKSDQIREDFTQMPAYDALMTELTTNEGVMTTFITAIMPKDFAAEMSKASVVSLHPAGGDKV